MSMGKCMHGCMGSRIAKTLLIIGGLNWGLIGVGMFMNADWNVVKMIFGTMPTVEAIVYILVGLSAVFKIFGCKCAKCKDVCASCSVEGKMEGNM